MERKFGSGLLAAATAATWLILSVPVDGHHSTQASYEMNRLVELTGTVVRFRMANPHSQLYVDVVDGSGKTVQWVVELASPGNWRRRGWNQDTFKPGDKIKLSIHPALSGAPAGHPGTITMADGTVVDQGGQKVAPGTTPVARD